MAVVWICPRCGDWTLDPHRIPGSVEWVCDWCARPLCPCGKHCYRTERAARMAIAAYQPRSGIQPVRAYWSEPCRAWHLTSALSVPRDRDPRDVATWIRSSERRPPAQTTPLSNPTTRREG